MLKQCVHEYRYRTRDQLQRPRSSSLHKGEGKQGSAEIDNYVSDPNPPSCPLEGKAMLRKPHSLCILETKIERQMKGDLWVAGFCFGFFVRCFFFF